MPQSESESPASPLARQLSAGLAKLGMALKSKAWQEAAPRNLTPTQAQILTILQAQATPARLSAIADRLSVTLPTASDAVSTLERKGLVVKTRAEDDARAVAITLTARGKREAWRVAAWPDFLSAAVDVLAADERAVFMKVLTKMIRTLQVQGDIPVSGMCVTCTHFRPNVYPQSVEAPHHCMLVNAAFGDRALRIECPEHTPAPQRQAEEAWRRFAEDDEALWEALMDDEAPDDEAGPAPRSDAAAEPSSGEPSVSPDEDPHGNTS